MGYIARTWRECPFCNEGGQTQTTSGDQPSAVLIECTHCGGTHKLAIGTNELSEGLYQTYQITECVDDTEYAALSASQKSIFALIMSLGVIDLSEGMQIRNKLWTMFGDGTTTRDNLEELVGG